MQLSIKGRCFNLLNLMQLVFTRVHMSDANGFFVQDVYLERCMFTLQYRYLLLVLI